MHLRTIYYYYQRLILRLHLSIPHLSSRWNWKKRLQ